MIIKLITVTHINFILNCSDPDLYVPVEEKLQEMLHQDHDYDIEPAEEIQSFNRIVFNGRLHLSFCDKIWTILKGNLY